MLQNHCVWFREADAKTRFSDGKACGWEERGGDQLLRELSVPRLSLVSSWRLFLFLRSVLLFHRPILKTRFPGRIGRGSAAQILFHPMLRIPTRYGAITTTSYLRTNCDWFRR